MHYPPAFFELQYEFARRLTARFDIALGDALHDYTTYSKVLDTAGWEQFLSGVSHTPNVAAWAYQCHRDHPMPKPLPTDTTYLGRPLFGCFSYFVRDATIIRIHFVKNDPLSVHPLSHERLPARHAEVRQMFRHIHEVQSQVETVLGNSWLYNLDAYRRIFPPAYTATLPVSDEAEFQYLAFWGQCFDHLWNPKPAITTTVFDRLTHLTNLNDLRWCFPYQTLQPWCEIGVFYQF